MMNDKVKTFAVALRSCAKVLLGKSRNLCAAPPSRGHAQSAIVRLRFCAAFAKAMQRAEIRP